MRNNLVGCGSDEPQPFFVLALYSNGFMKNNSHLTEAQKQDELLLDIMAYIKSCTNEIMIEAFAQILNL